MDVYISYKHIYKPLFILMQVYIYIWYMYIFIYSYIYIYILYICSDTGLYVVALLALCCMCACWLLELQRRAVAPPHASQMLLRCLFNDLCFSDASQTSPQWDMPLTCLSGVSSMRCVSNTLHLICLLLFLCLYCSVVGYFCTIWKSFIWASPCKASHNRSNGKARERERASEIDSIPFGQHHCLGYWYIKRSMQHHVLGCAWSVVGILHSPLD